MATSARRTPATPTKNRYIPRGRNHLHTIFERHFEDFCDVYDERYAPTYGMFRLNRIRDIGDRFLTCGDYRLGVARVRCTNPACGLIDHRAGQHGIPIVFRSYRHAPEPITPPAAQVSLDAGFARARTAMAQV